MHSLKYLDVGGDNMPLEFTASSLFTTLSETFTSVVGILTGNPITLVIIGCAVGVPILGAYLLYLAGVVKRGCNNCIKFLPLYLLLDGFIL